MEKKYPKDCALIPSEVEYPEEPPDCVFCWKVRQIIPQQKVRLLNPQYCWLYPKYERRLLKKIEPNFDHCKTLYTKCDYRLEQCAYYIIIQLEDQFRAHDELVKKEMKLQDELLDDMWLQSQRFMLLTGQGVCVKPYPEIISKNTEKRALCKFHRELRLVHESNCLIGSSMAEIRVSFTELTRRCAQLDMTVESPLIKGAWYMQSLKYIRNLLDDLFQYFYQHICKLKCWAQLLDPGDPEAIEDYMALIKTFENNGNNLMQYFDNCLCMRTKRKECLKPHEPC
uniref:Uncharacterized protein n=1 Tax=Glossina palpalis gambiensis TaxID=67801 RepID=A0A240SXF6_9MUSC